MNIVQEFYEDFISKKPKLPRFKKKHMNDVIANETAQETPQEEVVETPVAEPVEEVSPEVAQEAPRPAKDPSYNCQPCAGEGLLPTGNICGACKGTGKV